IFRMGLAASLRNSPFVVVGESTGLVPPPELDGVDVLVFDLGEPELGGRLTRRQCRSTRLVGLVPGGDPDELDRSQCTVLVRSELTPEGFRDCLASVVAGASGPAGRSGAAEGRVAGSVRAAWSDAGARVRRGLGRRGALFVVVAALAAGAFGPSGKAEGLSAGGPGRSTGTSTSTAADGPAEAAPAAAETTPVSSDGDAADDIAVWVDPADPSASLVIGTDKRGALETYDLSGRRVQRLPRPAGSVNNVDVRPGFSLGGRTVALVGTGGRAMSFFRLDSVDRQLHEVGAHVFPRQWAEVGFCLYRSAVTGRFYAFLAEPDGDVTQYELFDQGGLVDARAVRGWPLGGRAEGCVADDETGRLFVSEEKSGIWRYDAEPEGSPLARTQVDKVDGGHLVADVEGLAIVTQPGRRGFLLASSQGDSTFAVYRRGRDNAWLGQREVADGTAADGCSDTDGIEAVAANLGPDFPAGIFICQDGRNTAPGSAGHQNFKYVRLEQIIDAASLPT
ncbi:MAG TPA: phytase, partial [Acidimicrobiia bacterium]|nr:phytase [Acidimicrobiia bacterium]